jgi:peptide/nickel transport system permease protein
MRLLVGLTTRLIVSLVAISVIVFTLTTIPGDPARDILGQYATASQITAFNQEHGLNSPPVTQYWHWLSGIFHGDWGKSYQAGAPVWGLIAPRLDRTLVLVAMAWLLNIVVSIPVGLVAGMRLRGRSDIVLTLVTLSIAALPEFVIGLLLIVIFAITLHWLPVDSTAANGVSPGSAISSYILPACTIALALIPYTLRLARANARDVVAEPFVRAAVLRGIGEPSLSLRYVLPNAAPPVINALALQLAGLIGGVVVAETVFGFPGLGQLLVQSAGSRDAPVVEALALMMGGFFVIVNLLADTIVVLVTPKLRDSWR